AGQIVVIHQHLVRIQIQQVVDFQIQVFQQPLIGELHIRYRKVGELREIGLSSHSESKFLAQGSSSVHSGGSQGHGGIGAAHRRTSHHTGGGDHVGGGAFPGDGAAVAALGGEVQIVSDAAGVGKGDGVQV